MYDRTRRSPSCSHRWWSAAGASWRRPATASSDRSHLVGLLWSEVAVAGPGVLAVVALIGGDRPVELATFVGYLVMSVLFLPAAVGLSLMERTRWGSVIAGSAARSWSPC